MSLLWLPEAQRDYHARSFPWAERTDPKGCLHTTEGSGWPDYRGWSVMPHATVMPTRGKGVTIRQHLPFDQASFALRHTRPQPTNGDYVFQFELVGTCDPNGPGYFWPNADDTVLTDLWRKVIKPLDAAFVIPFRALQFLPYPRQAGSNRLTDAQFDVYSGWLGHQHVPQNDHGDPGAFPWARLAAIAKADMEDDMPLSDDDVIRVAQAVWHSDKVYINSGWSGGLQSPAWHLNATSRYAIEGGFNGNRPDGNSQAGTPTRARDVAITLDEVQASLKALADAVAKLAPPAAS